MKYLEPFWARLLVTVAVMLAASYAGGLLWGRVFGSTLPGYIAGMIGGLAALPVWDILKRFRPKAK